MRILILFTFLITNALGNELPDLKNLVVHKIPKIYDNVIFLDDADEEINIQNLDSKLIILNFWATWCEPCKDEMPSLNRLQVNQKLKNLKIYPINIGKENLNKVKTVPYKHNYGYFFSSGPNTWHGMEKKEIVKERRCLQVNYVTFPTDWKVF